MDNSNSPAGFQIYLAVLLICLASTPLMFVLDRWAGLSPQRRIFDSWPFWLRPRRGGWVITCSAIWLAIVVLGAWKVLSWQVALSLIWLHLLVTFYLERRHLVEVASTPGTETDDSGIH